jgi:hypothetical protein
MPSRRTIYVFGLGVLLSACRSASDPIAEVPPSLTVSPSAVIAGPPGSRVRVGALVQGLGPSPTLEWTSLAPGAVVVDSVLDGGRTAVLRFDRPQATLVLVTARGTRAQSDTLYVTLLAARTE